VIDYSRFHCGCHAQRLVNPAEVVVGEVQAVRGPQVFPLLREGIRQPRKAAHAHLDRQVLALHVGRADEVRIGVAHDWDLLRIRDIGRAVPALTFGIGIPTKNIAMEASPYHLNPA
jgi:hypothetical protein